MSMGKKSVSLMVVLCLAVASIWLIIGIFPKEVSAQEAPALNLPEAKVKMVVFPDDWVIIPDDLPSYFDTQLYEVPPGFDVSSGWYNGWCLDKYHYIYVGWVYWTKLYSSYDPNLPAGYKNYDWNRINYVLNHKHEQSVMEDIQDAIYYFIYGGDLPSRPLARAMVQDALQNGQDFVPGCKETIAVICDAGFPDVQLSIIEIPVILTIEGLISLVKRLYEQGLITNYGIYNSLLDKLNAAQDSFDRGNYGATLGQLGGFSHIVKAQTDKFITEQASETLLAYTSPLLLQITRDKARTEAIEKINKEAKKAKKTIQKKKDLTEDQKNELKDKIDRIVEAGKEALKPKKYGAYPEAIRIITAWTVDRIRQVPAGTDECPKGWAWDLKVLGTPVQDLSKVFEVPKRDWGAHVIRIKFTILAPKGTGMLCKIPKPDDTNGGFGYTRIAEPNQPSDSITATIIVKNTQWVGKESDLIYIKILVSAKKNVVWEIKLMLHLDNPIEVSP